MKPNQSNFSKSIINAQINPLSLLQKHSSLKKQTQSNTKYVQSHSYNATNILLSQTKQFSKTKGISKDFFNKKQKKSAFKTKMCPDGRQCKRQFTCTFAHHQKQLRKPFMKRTKPCLLYQRGQCSLGSACRQYHGNMDLKKNYQYKSEMCKQFLQSGKCQKGKLCIKKHGQHDNGILGQNQEADQLILNDQKMNQEINQKQCVQAKQQMNQEEVHQLKGKGDSIIQKGQLQNGLIKKVEQNQKESKGRQRVQIKQIEQKQIKKQEAIEQGGLFIQFQ